LNQLLKTRSILGAGLLAVLSLCFAAPASGDPAGDAGFLRDVKAVALQNNDGQAVSFPDSTLLAIAHKSCSLLSGGAGYQDVQIELVMSPADLTQSSSVFIVEAAIENLCPGAWPPSRYLP
jgi:hypothetical protein